MKSIKLSSFQSTGNEIDYIKQAIDKSEISNYGKNLELFEEQLKNYLSNNSKITLLNSGTSAIHLALINLGVKQNDEVICQSFTFCASANPILYLGAKPVFIDSENDTWNISPIYLEKAIQDRISKGKLPKAIIIVHTYGMPCKINDLKIISQKYNIPIIEDAAEALGSKYKGQKCGTFGNYGVISFNANKIITASGGGVLICKTNKERNKTLFLANQAKDKTPHYQHTEIGYNYLMNNIIAAIGRAQMEVLDSYINESQKTHKFYKKLFENVEGVTVFTEPEAIFDSNYWLTCILINENITRFNNEDLRLELLEHNIESRPLWKPLHTQPIFKNYQYFGSNVCENLFKKGLCLPSESNLSKDEKQRIKTVIENLILFKMK